MDAVSGAIQTGVDAPLAATKKEIERREAAEKLAKLLDEED